MCVCHLIIKDYLLTYLLTYLLRTKYELDRMNGFREMAIQNYTRLLTAATLDLVQSDVGSFDSLTPKTLPTNQI